MAHSSLIYIVLITHAYLFYIQFHCITGKSLFFFSNFWSYGFYLLQLQRRINTPEPGDAWKMNSFKCNLQGCLESGFECVINRSNMVIAKENYIFSFCVWRPKLLVSLWCQVNLKTRANCQPKIFVFPASCNFFFFFFYICCLLLLLLLFVYCLL